MPAHVASRKYDALSRGITPAQLPGLAAWYAADYGVLTSVSPDVSATDGQTVRRWLDKSGNGNHLNQATLANQPTISAVSSIGNAASINFDSISKFMDSSYAPGSLFTMYFLVKIDTLLTGYQVLSCRPGGTNYYMATTTNGAAKNYVQTSSGGRDGSRRDTLATLWGWSVNGTAHIFSQDGLAQNTTALLSAPSADLFRIGADNNGSNGWRGFVSECLIYSSAHTLFEADKLWTWCKRKYGL